MRPRLYSPNFLRCVRRTTVAPVNWLARIATQLRSARLHVAPGPRSWLVYGRLAAVRAFRRLGDSAAGDPTWLDNPQVAPPRTKAAREPSRAACAMNCRASSERLLRA